MTVSESKRSHSLKGILENAISGRLGTKVDDDIREIVQVVLRTLDQQRLISYAPAGDMALLTTHGRTFVAVAENRNATQRSLAVYLGISETNLQKSLKLLCDKGFVVKTKVNNSFRYEIDPKMAFSHSDISRFFDAIAGMVASTLEGDEGHSEDPPF